MRARDPEQEHRASTPLELFFDLTFVVAVSLAAEELATRLAEGHGFESVGSYLVVFFGIWWGWLNFTWFASAYDTDDWLYRAVTFVQMAGALTVAAGVPNVVEHHDFNVVVTGYVIMRIALGIQWLRAGHGDPQRRTAAHRYAIGIGLVQVGWVAWSFLPSSVATVLLPLLIIGELSVPPLAERHVRTTYHPRHVVERYGLFTIIVLGEGVLASGNAVIAALREGEHIVELVALAACGLVLLAGMWWIYFEVATDEDLTTLRKAIPWGYGHYAVFAGAAAVSSGIELQVEQITGHSDASASTTALLLGAPLAIFLVATWALVMRRQLSTGLTVTVLGVAVLAVAAPTFLRNLAEFPVAVPLCEAILVLGLVFALICGGSGRTENVLAD